MVAVAIARLSPASAVLQLTVAALILRFVQSLISAPRAILRPPRCMAANHQCSTRLCLVIRLSTLFRNLTIVYLCAGTEFAQRSKNVMMGTQKAGTVAIQPARSRKDGLALFPTPGALPYAATDIYNGPRNATKGKIKTETWLLTAVALR